jgi:hypothetical protein
MPKFPEDSCYKLWISFNDGKNASFFSRDWKHEKGEIIPSLGLSRLISLIEKGKFKGQYKTAQIFDRKEDKVIAKYVNGIKIL